MTNRLDIGCVYDVIDLRTKAVVAKGLTFKGSIRSVDRRDNAYGGYRFTKVCRVTDQEAFDNAYDRESNREAIRKMG